MKAILVPVKPFHRAKQRLAGSLSPAARAKLAQALCEDFFALLVRVRNVERIFVVSAEPWAVHAAHNQGWEAIVEADPTSESQSVDLASRHCMRAGVTALLRVPIDLPLALPEDIEDILAKTVPSPSAVIVPSQDERGTNALLRAPPDLFASHFGQDSFAAHLNEARRLGAEVSIVRNPELAHDLDDWHDLCALKPRVSAETALGRWFSGTDLSPPRE